MKVSILTMDGGNGTISASLALKEWLDAKGADCSVVDFIGETDAFAGMLAGLYNRLLRGDLRLASMYMELAHRFPKDWYNTLNAVSRRRAVRLLERERPDVVVLTSPWIIEPVLGALASAGGRRPRVLTVVVDLGAGMPGQWWNPGADLTMLPTAESMAFLQGIGLDPNKARVAGMPLSPSLMEGRPSKEAGLGTFGLKGPLCTVMGGREGGSSCLRIAALLTKEAPDVQVLVQCGRNVPLLRKARKIKGLAAVGYLENMRELYAASDVVITKPGALTVSELVALRKPFILDAALAVMPQERGNVRFVEDRRLGLVACRHGDIPGMVRSIMDGRRDFGSCDIHGTAHIGKVILGEGGIAPDQAGVGGH